MFRICFSLFVTGILMASGPCLISCGPVLTTYLAATKRSFIAGLRSWFIFSAARIFVYVFLGIVAGFTGAGLFKRFYWEGPSFIIWISGGLFISFLGLLIFFGKESRFSICRVLNQEIIQKDIKSLLTLGVLISILPCAPLIGILSYITMASNNYLQGALMGLSFALGTIISPLILLSMLAGEIGKIKWAFFHKLCGLILVFFGAHIIIKTLLQYLERL